MSELELLPTGWVLGTIEDSGEYINGFAFKPEYRSESGLPIIRIQNLTDENKPIHLTDIEVDDVYKVTDGDILVSWSATLDAFIWRRGAALVNQHIFKVVPENRLIEKKLLFYWLKIAIEDLQKTEHLHGSTMKHINRGPFMAHKLPFPPKPEQSKILEKLEELLSDLDNGIAELKAAQTKLTQYRQSLLKSAVEGTLTQEWREANAHKITETGEQLLAQILKERRARWEKQKLEEFARKNQTPPKDWQKKYPEPVKPDTSDLPELPEGWVWASIDQLSWRKRYGSSSKTDDRSDGVPVLRMGNIQDGQIDYTNLKYLPVDHDEFPDLLLADGDLLFNRTNSAELVGKTAIFRDIGTPCSYASYLISVTFCDSYQPDLAAYFINSVYGKAWLSTVVNQTAGQANVNGTKLGELAIPVPPIEEQLEIINKMIFEQDQVQSQLHNVEVGIRQSEAQRKNILKDAFSGKLVPQDPSDEPASVLLEKIKAERLEKARQPKPKQTKKKANNKANLMDTLSEVLKANGNWMDAQEAFRACGVADGTETDRIEELYAELRKLDKAGKLLFERQGDYDLIKLKEE